MTVDDPWMERMRRGLAGMGGFAWLNAYANLPTPAQPRPSLDRVVNTMRRGDRPAPQPGGESTVAWLVTLARAGYGVGLVCVPGLMIGLCGQQLGRWDCTVARVLGVRHLVQAAVTVAAQRVAPGRPVVLGGGAAVDLLHAGSMVALGAVDERVRRSTLTDAAVETALAVVGAVAAASSAG